MGLPVDRALMAGHLPCAPLTIQVLGRLSPSRFLIAKSCPLRATWSATHVPLIPVSPRARLGTATHQLLEMAGNGRFHAGDLAGIDEAWSLLVTQIEASMQVSWLDRHLAPLSESVSDYEVVRLRARAQADLVAHRRRKHSGGLLPGPRTGFEVWVQSDDGLVGGYVDQIVSCEDGLVVRDYKSGCVVDRPESMGTVNDGYAAQVKLYAALHYATFGVWPAHLELVPLHGPPFRLAVNRTECTALLHEAKRILRHVNGIIEGATAVGSTSDRQERLAAPSAEACRFCQFRPACQPYRSAAEVNASDQWPCDTWGELTEVSHLRNGRISLSLTDSGAARARRLRGLSPEGRHPALAGAVSGASLAAFGLRHTGAQGEYGETPLTVLYRGFP